ncbi:MAG: hypothetical protein PHW31_02645 [Candidatus Pacebacteria bacterium]|nr:hypothetical protein [Candidatus Paceibacterota bacterium]
MSLIFPGTDKRKPPKGGFLVDFGNEFCYFRASLILPIRSVGMKKVDKQVDKEKKKIKEEIEKAKHGQHECQDSQCLINEVVPIALNIKTEEGMGALVDLVHFYFDQRRILAEGGDLIAVGRIEIKDVVVEDFQQLLNELKEEPQGEVDKLKKKWVLVGREAGQDHESIVALYQLFYLVKVIFYTWEVVRERKKLEKAILN